MPRAVVTVTIGEEYEKLGTISHASLRAYAERIDAEFVVLDKQRVSKTTPHWEKLQLHDLLRKYERIVYLDTDLLVRDDCPNLFELVPPTYLGAFNEAPFTGGRELSLYQSLNDYGLTAPKWDGSYYNTGVMVISRHQRHLFAPVEEEHRKMVGADTFFEQGLLNARIAAKQVPVFRLPAKFNRMTCYDGVDGLPRHAAYIMHYAGCPNYGHMRQLMADDLKIWETASPDYAFKRQVWLEITGGIGDQLCAEPTVRWFMENMAEGCDVTLTTHWPELFQHIEGLTIGEHGMAWDKDVLPFRRNSLPPPESLFQVHVSSLLCHQTDFASLAVLRRTLPLDDRRIRLEPTLEGFSEAVDVVGIRSFDELIAVHPGAHWPSKTFPDKWWQDVVDGLHEAGAQVCLIGQDGVDRGTVQVEARAGMIDTRNLLSLRGLISLLCGVGVLVSNDSAPVHIAGAFDAPWIVLIPTCKAPEHVLPYRYGSPFWRASALYKKLTLDDVPQSPWIQEQVLADEAPEDWSKYLPEPKQVVQEAMKHVGYNVDKRKDR